MNSQTDGTFEDSLKELERISINGMKSAFIPYKARCKVIFDTIKPAFKKIRAS